MVRECPAKGKGRGEDTAAHFGSTSAANDVEYVSLEEFQAMEAIFFFNTMETVDELEAYAGGLYGAYLQYLEAHNAYDPLGDEPIAEDAVQPMSFHDWMFGNDENYLLMEASSPEDDEDIPLHAAPTADELWHYYATQWDPLPTQGNLPTTPTGVQMPPHMWIDTGATHSTWWSPEPHPCPERGPPPQPSCYPHEAPPLPAQGSYGPLTIMHAAMAEFERRCRQRGGGMEAVECSSMYKEDVDACDDQEIIEAAMSFVTATHISDRDMDLQLHYAKGRWRDALEFAIDLHRHIIETAGHDIANRVGLSLIHI